MQWDWTPNNMDVKQASQPYIHACSNVVHVIWLQIKQTLLNLERSFHCDHLIFLFCPLPHAHPSIEYLTQHYAKCLILFLDCKVWFQGDWSTIDIDVFLSTQLWTLSSIPLHIFYFLVVLETFYIFFFCVYIHLNVIWSGSCFNIYVYSS